MEHHYIDVPFSINILAGVEGFEPSQAVLETDVLPLTLYSYIKYSTIITQKKFFDNTFVKKNIILKKIHVDILDNM